MFSRLPDLDDLSAGWWYFGNVRIADGDGSVARNSIKIYRGLAEEPNSEFAEDEMSELESKWHEVNDNSDSSAAEKLQAMYEWADSEPSNGQLQLQKFDLLNSLGLGQQLRIEAASFLKSFPEQRDEFMSAANSWK